MNPALWFYTRKEAARMSDRYKEMGLEMLPNKHYAAWSDEPRPGLAMVYRTRDKVIPVICDEERIVT